MQDSLRLHQNQVSNFLYQFQIWTTPVWFTASYASWMALDASLYIIYFICVLSGGSCCWCALHTKLIYRCAVGPLRCAIWASDWSFSVYAAARCNLWQSHWPCFLSETHLLSMRALMGFDKQKTDSHAEPCQIVTRDGNSVRASALETDLLEFIILKFCVCCAARALKTPTGNDLPTHAPNICSSCIQLTRKRTTWGCITNTLLHQQLWKFAFFKFLE